MKWVVLAAKACYNSVNGVQTPAGRRNIRRVDRAPPQSHPRRLLDGRRRERTVSGMKLALIADIHANLPAFEAVLADIDRRGIDRILCLGDMVGKGPPPRRGLRSLHGALRGESHWQLGVRHHPCRPSGAGGGAGPSADAVEYRPAGPPSGSPPSRGCRTAVHAPSADGWSGCSTPIPATSAATLPTARWKTGWSCSSRRMAIPTGSRVTSRSTGTSTTPICSCCGGG